MAAPTPPYDTMSVLFVLQALLLIFSAFVSWWLRDLLSQFRNHCQSCDTSQATMLQQVAEVRASLLYLQKSVENTQLDMRDMREQLMQNGRRGDRAL